MIAWCWIGQRCSKYVRFLATNRLELWLLWSVYETIWMRSTATRRKHPLILLAGKTTYWRWTWNCIAFYYESDGFSNRKPRNKRMDMTVVYLPANSLKPCLAARTRSTSVKMIYPTFADGWSGRLGTQNSELTHNIICPFFWLPRLLLSCSMEYASCVAVYYYYLYIIAITVLFKGYRWSWTRFPTSPMICTVQTRLNTWSESNGTEYIIKNIPVQSITLLISETTTWPRRTRRQGLGRQCTRASGIPALKTCCLTVETFQTEFLMFLRTRRSTKLNVKTKLEQRWDVTHHLS